MSQRISSHCECEATVSAELDVCHRARFGWAVHPLGGDRVPCPAISVRFDPAQVEVSWLCPFCGRNLLRSFLLDPTKPQAI